MTNGQVLYTDSMDMLDKRIVKPTWDSVKLHHPTQNGVQSKTDKLLASGIFHVIFSDQSQPQVMETMDEWGGY